MTKPSLHWPGWCRQQLYASIAVWCCFAVTGVFANGQDSAPSRLPSVIVPEGALPAAAVYAEPVSQAPLSNNIGPARFQSGFPSELILPPPSDAARRRESRFVESEVDPELPLSLVLGRPKILRLADTPRRIFVPDDKTIRAEIIDRESGRELAVTGLKPGTTTLMLWFEDESERSGESIVSYVVRVYESPALKRPIEQVQRELNEKFPNSFVELSELDGSLVVEGQARDSFELTRIMQLLLVARGGMPGVRSSSRTNVSTVNFETTAPDAQTIQTQEQLDIDRVQYDAVAVAQAGIINLMRVPGEQQVMLRVTVAEVNRTAARSLGLNFTAIQNNNLFSNTTGSIAGNIQAILDGGDISLRIEALRRLSLSRTLAEPNLVAINGQTANFQAGGQFPIPVIASGGVGTNLQGVQFVPFGVQLQFLPVIQDRDVIRLQINADVSTRDESLGTNIGGGGGGGTSVPGLNSRNFSSTVELRSGQTLAVAGLLQTNFGASSDRVPFFGDLPLIGPLTGANRTSASEQELVILVTPELVAPVDSCVTPGLPGNDVYEPTDVEFYLSNRLESRRSRDFRSPVRTDYHKQRRPDLGCPDRFIIGSNGPTDRCCNQPVAVPHQPVPTIGESMPTVYSTPMMIDEVSQ
ncbi:type II and III secretion system protein family protein [Novipirellula sp.]|uniref:type II and III secretion system protein family protein n=1 Tax=Novipirellula sp. TaxID=2795430 RepID=UPI0035628488